MTNLDRSSIFCPTIHQSVRKSPIKCFDKFSLFNIIQNLLKPNIPLDELANTINEIGNGADFEAADVKCGADENIDELKNRRKFVMI